MSACGVCGKARRTGSGGRVTVIENGTIRSALACAECMRRGIIIVAPPTIPTLTKATLDDDERDVRTVLRKLAKHLRGVAKAKNGGRAAVDLIGAEAEGGEIDGILTAADIADAWAARPEARR